MYKQYLFWLGFSLLVSIGFNLILPGWFGLAATLGFWIILPLIMMKSKLFRKIAKLDNFYGPTNNFNIKVGCRTCGNQSDKTVCPKCGSKNRGLI